jgi:hypothetical protein
MSYLETVAWILPGPSWRRAGTWPAAYPPYQ